MKNLNLTNKDGNAKTVKGQKLGYKTAVLYMAPHKLALSVFRSNKKAFQQALKKRYNVDVKQWIIEEKLKAFNACEFARTCIKPCLNTAGLGGVYPSIQFARSLKTAFYALNRESFLSHLKHELGLFYKKTLKDGFNPVFRLNGTSDLEEFGFIKSLKSDYEKLSIYDYTKDLMRFYDNPIPEYSLSYSIQDYASFRQWQNLKHGGNCTIITKQGIDDPILEKFKDYLLINGDESDLRFLDPVGKGIVVLKAKGKARNSKSKFIVNNWS